MSNQDHKIWLIKNNNQIIGPFTEEQVKTKLKNKALSPFATVCKPGLSFWGFLAAYPEFKEFADQSKRPALFTMHPEPIYAPPIKPYTENQNMSSKTAPFLPYSESDEQKPSTLKNKPHQSSQTKLPGQQKPEGPKKPDAEQTTSQKKPGQKKQAPLLTL